MTFEQEIGMGAASLHLMAGGDEVGVEGEDAEDWEECTDDDGNVYFYNLKTGLSQWEAPRFKRKMAKLLDSYGDANTSTAERARAALLEHKTERDFARLFLRGSVPTDFELDTSTLREGLSACAHVVELRDETWPEYDLEAVAQESTVRGNFVRTLSARLQETPEEERDTIRRAIYFGLDAFTGRPQVR